MKRSIKKDRKAKNENEVKNDKILNRNAKIFNVLNIVFIVAVLAVACVLGFMILRYGEINRKLILAAILVLVVIVLLNTTLSLSSMIFQKKMILRYISVFVALVLTLVGSYGIYIVSSLNNTIGNIVDTDTVKKEVITSYFITYDNATAKDESFIKGKNVGVLENESILEGNVFPKQKIEELGYTVKYVEYESYADMMFGLFTGEIDVASVPTTYKSVFSDEDQQDENMELVNVIYEYDTTAEVSTNTNTNVNLTEPFSVLIIGVDSMSAGNSDVLMLATFNPNTLDLTLTSIARDSWVPISCYGGNLSKINAARTTRQCLIDTVEDLLGVEINFYFETNFKGVVEIVDALGGIVINSELEFVGQNSDQIRGTKTVWVPAGESWADGEQVLAFVRERKAFPDGDFARQRHQQQVIGTLIDEMLQLNDINKMLNVLNAAGNNIATNMSVSQITELATFALNVYNTNYDQNSYIFDIQSSRVTGYASWTYNMRSEQRLWIYRLYNGSIKDNVDIIKNNLEITKNLEYPSGMNALIFAIWRDSKSTPEYYNETQIHDPMPAFVENFIGKNVSDMVSWANTNGVSLDITYLSEGDAGYDANLEPGTIVTQDVTSGRVALVSTIRISVIKSPVDCSDPANENDAVCAVSYINAVDKTIDYVVEWANKRGITLTMNEIPVGEGYDITKAGRVKTQTEKAYSKFNDAMTLGVTYYAKINVRFVDINDAEISGAAKNVIYGKTIDLPSYACPDGYKFDGWVSNGSTYTGSVAIQSAMTFKASCSVQPVEPTPDPSAEPTPDPNVTPTPGGEGGTEESPNP